MRGRSDLQRIVLVMQLLIVASCSAQPDQNSELIRISLHTAGIKTAERPPLKKENAAIWRKPLYFAGRMMIFVYQNVFSEQIQADCTYAISCSEFTRRAIHRRGPVRGLLLGFNQISECHRGAVYEHPALYIDHEKKIRNQPDHEAH